MRTIDAEALKEAIRKRLGISSLKYLTEQEKVIVEEINNAPTIEPTFGLFKDMLCSECEKRPQGEYGTACNVLLSLEQIVRKSEGWEDSAIEAVHNAVQTAMRGGENE